MNRESRDGAGDSRSDDSAAVVNAMAPANASDQPTDPDLMRRVRDHDESALASLYDRYTAQVNGLALSILRDPALSEEVTHDVFLRLWQQPESYDPARGAFAAWLLRVARNRSIDLLRRRREHVMRGLAEQPAAMIPDPEPDPEEQTIIRLRRQEVRQALDELAFDHRQLLELAYFSGMSQRQIAQHLERPLGTVKSQIRSAMRHLADRLAPVEPPSERT